MKPPLPRRIRIRRPAGDPPDSRSLRGSDPQRCSRSAPGGRSRAARSTPRSSGSRPRAASARGWAIPPTSAAASRGAISRVTPAGLQALKATHGAFANLDARARNRCWSSHEPPTSARRRLLAERLLPRRSATRTWRDSILGDLREEFRAVRDTVGAARGPALVLAAGALHRRAHGGSRAAAASRPPAALDRRRTRTPGAAGAGLVRDLRHAGAHAACAGRRRALVIVAHARAGAGDQQHELRHARRARPAAVPLPRPRSARHGRLERSAAGALRSRVGDRRRLPRLAPRGARRVDALVGGGMVGCQPLGHRTARAGRRASSVTRRLLRCARRARRSSAAPSSPTKKRPATTAASCSATRCGRGSSRADPAIVGRTVRVDGEPYEVVGVAPPGFAIPAGAQIWAPLAYYPGGVDRPPQPLADDGRPARRRRRRSKTRAPSSARSPSGQRRDYPETNAQLPNAVVTFTDGMSDPGAGAFMSDDARPRACCCC